MNLTPHAINIQCENGVEITIPPDGRVARVAMHSVKIGVKVVNTATVPCFIQETGEVQGLPDPAEGVCWVVSAMVRLAVPGRFDVASPGELVRGADGQPVGCRGLILN